MIVSDICFDHKKKQRERFKDICLLPSQCSKKTENKIYNNSNKLIFTCRESKREREGEKMY